MERTRDLSATTLPCQSLFWRVLELPAFVIEQPKTIGTLPSTACSGKVSCFRTHCLDKSCVRTLKVISKVAHCRLPVRIRRVSCASPLRAQSDLKAAPKLVRNLGQPLHIRRHPCHLACAPLWGALSTSLTIGRCRACAQSTTRILCEQALCRSTLSCCRRAAVRDPG